MSSKRRTLPLAHALLAAAILAGGASTASAQARPLADREALASEYRAWLDQARTPTRAVDFVRERSPGWTVIDPVASEPRAFSPGARLIFIDRDRSAILVIIGERALHEHGARLIAAHIDTPSPRLSLVKLKPAGQLQLKAVAYGGMRLHHWLHLPLAVVGRVAHARKSKPAAHARKSKPVAHARKSEPAAPARKGKSEIDVALGLHDDDFAFYATDMDARARTLTITAGSVPTGDGNTITAGSVPAGDGNTSATLMHTLHQRYGLTARDLQAAELFVVPRHRAREVGLDRALIGAHGQDDRANSYVAWRAILDLDRPPPHTAIVWLTDREEVGSHHVAGAASQLLELVFAYLLRAEGVRATEAVLARALARTQALSADTPPAIHPNWPEVQEAQNAPVIGKGPALFPFTGRGGKHGGSAAGAELVRSVIDSFARSGAPLQHGTLGRVDEGGGGTVAQFLAARGMDIVDLGVPLIGLHSPMELSAKDDLWAAYRGFRAWLAERGDQAPSPDNR